MRVLYLDSSTERLVVGLSWNGASGVENVWRSAKTGLNHAQKILGFVDEIFLQTNTSIVDLAAVACSLGPGSFTGLRIGLCTAKGLAEGWNLPLLGIDALEAMARSSFHSEFPSESVWLPVIDARKGRFYTRVFKGRDSTLERTDEALDLSPSDFIFRWSNDSVRLCGYQASLLAERLRLLGPLPQTWTSEPETGWEAALGQCALEALLTDRRLEPWAGPLYVRASEAEENLGRRR